MLDCGSNVQHTPIPVPYWTESTKATECNTCGRDIWVGERVVISGPTIHCWRCGSRVANHEDTGAIQ